VFRWRKKTPRLGVPTRTPYVWADVAVPPSEPAETATHPAAPADASAVLPPEPLFAAPPAPARLASIRLGFSDGTSLELDEGSVESDAFRAAALRLLGPGEQTQR
jgi:hypothetical protein